MPRYTFILDFEGGTYLSQVDATGHLHAQKVWLKEKVPEDFDIARLHVNMDELPTPVKGLANTWCFTFLVSDKLVLVHYVETVQ